MHVPDYYQKLQKNDPENGTNTSNHHNKTEDTCIKTHKK